MQHRFRTGPLQIPSAIRLWVTLSVMFRLAQCSCTLHTVAFLPSRVGSSRTAAGGTASSLLRIRRSSKSSLDVQTRFFAASSCANNGNEETKVTLHDAAVATDNNPQSMNGNVVHPDVVSFEESTKNGMDILQEYKSTTVSGILSESIELMEQHNIPEPTESAINLLAASLDLPWETGHRDLRQLVSGAQQPWSSSLSSERHLTPIELQDYFSKIDRRLQHEPIQYILGQWDFMDYTLRIERPLLCPRPETEELVDLVLIDMKNNPEIYPTLTVGSKRRVFDIGCGTGCIGIALAAADSGDSDIVSIVTAIDVEPVAVKVAAENAALILGPAWRDRYRVTLKSVADYQLTKGDGGGDDNRFHVVVSNPPYIPATDKDSLTADVVHYESATALFGGHDGLDIIRTIVRRLPEWCVAGAICWMEVDPTHPALLRQWIDEEESSASDEGGATLGVEYLTECQDLSGRDRFVKLRVVETR